VWGAFERRNKVSNLFAVSFSRLIRGRVDHLISVRGPQKYAPPAH